jgi:3-oxoacyl-[acyl-carrier protein] reductase
MTALKLRKNPEAYISRIPVGRVAQPEEIADLVLFLVSSRNSYMTGATIDISGGMLMR